MRRSLNGRASSKRRECHELLCGSKLPTTEDACWAMALCARVCRLRLDWRHPGSCVCAARHTSRFRLVVRRNRYARACGSSAVWLSHQALPFAQSSRPVQSRGARLCVAFRRECMGTAFAGSFVRRWNHLGTMASRQADYLALDCSPFCFASGRLLSSHLVFPECPWLYGHLILVPHRDLPLHP